MLCIVLCKVGNLKRLVLKINSAWSNLKQLGIRAYLERGGSGSREENTQQLVRFVVVWTVSGAFKLPLGVAEWKRVEET